MPATRIQTRPQPSEAQTSMSTDLTARSSPPASDATRARAGLGSRALRSVVGRLLSTVQAGRLELRLPDGSRQVAQGERAGPSASIEIHRWRALARLAGAGDIGLASAYRDGDWSSDDLVALLEFGLANESAWASTLAGSRLARMFARVLHRRHDNTRRGSRRNIAFHYDLGNAFYRQWLDADLIYSSALYRGDETSLEAAQAAKLERIVELLQVDTLDASSSTLEIGCGWGALALALARRQPGRVTGLTLSTEQLAHARERVREAGVDARVDLRLQDYRDVEGRHDRIVSIEMLEAVGEAWWPTYFDTLRERLKPGGRAVIQVITIADSQFESYRRGADFIQRFIFPGGMLPSPGALRAQIDRAGLALAGAETFGESYARTLVEWRRRFEAAWPSIAPLGFDESFRRLWRYYLCYCEAGFHAGRVDVGLYVIEKPAHGS